MASGHPATRVVPWRRWARAAPIVALLVAACNQRPAIASIGPVLDQIRGSLSLSAGTVSVLTALPVLLFGAIAPPGDGCRSGSGCEAPSAHSASCWLPGW